MIFLIKNTFSTQTVPKITIYEEIISPDNKFIAVYYNIEDGMAVKDYDQICIRENNGISLKATIKNDIDNFAPYIDRLFTINNNHSKLDVSWDGNTTLIVKYDFDNYIDIAVKQDSYETHEFNQSTGFSKIQINYIDI